MTLYCGNEKNRRIYASVDKSKHITCSGMIDYKDGFGFRAIPNKNKDSYFKCSVTKNLEIQLDQQIYLCRIANKLGAFGDE